MFAADTPEAAWREYCAARGVSAAGVADLGKSGGRSTPGSEKVIDRVVRFGDNSACYSVLDLESDEGG